MDYATPVTTSSNIDGATAAGIFMFSLFIFIVALVFTVVMIIGMWKMFVKAGKPGWAAIVPFYNYYVLMEIAGYNGWMFLLVFIPYVGSIIVLIMSGIGLAKNFGKSTTFAIVGLILFSGIGYLILGFGKDKYIGGGFQPTTPAPPAAPIPPTTPAAPQA